MDGAKLQTFLSEARAPANPITAPIVSPLDYMEHPRHPVRGGEMA